MCFVLSQSCKCVLSSVLLQEVCRINSIYLSAQICGTWLYFCTNITVSDKRWYHQHRALHSFKPCLFSFPIFLSFERWFPSDTQRCCGGSWGAGRHGMHPPERPPRAHHLLEEKQHSSQRSRRKDHCKSALGLKESKMIDSTRLVFIPIDESTVLWLLTSGP